MDLFTYMFLFLINCIEYSISFFITGFVYHSLEMNTMYIVWFIDFAVHL